MTWNEIQPIAQDADLSWLCYVELCGHRDAKEYFSRCPFNTSAINTLHARFLSVEIQSLVALVFRWLISCSIVVFTLCTVSECYTSNVCRGKVHLHSPPITGRPGTMMHTTHTWHRNSLPHTYSFLLEFKHSVRSFVWAEARFKVGQIYGDPSTFSNDVYKAEN